MKNILWHQSAQTSGESVYVIDGTISTYANSGEQNEALTVMRRAQKGKRYDIINNETNHTTSQVYLRGFKSLLLKSNFISKDDSDRQIAFIFYTSDPKNATVTLHQYSNKIAMELQPQEKAVVEQALARQRATIKKLIITIVSILAIFMILKLIIH